MQYIETHTLLPGWTSVLGLVGMAFFFLLSLFFIIRSERHRSRRDSGIAYLLLLPMIVSGIFAAVAGLEDFSERRETLRQEISDQYGIELTTDEIFDLSYPSEEPTADFEAFGSFDKVLRVDGELLKREVYLIWEDGKFFLAESATGEEFTELEAKR